MHGLNSMDFAAPRLIWPLPLLSTYLPTTGASANTLAWDHSLRDQLAICWQVLGLDSK